MRVLALLLVATTLHAGDFQLRLDIGKTIQWMKDQHRSVPTSRKVRRLTGLAAAMCSVGDYVSTKEGFKRLPNGQGCEANPRLQAADGCQLNERKFLGVKAGVNAGLLAEELLNNTKHEEVLNREASIANGGLAALFCVITVRNTLQGR